MKKNYLKFFNKRLLFVGAALLAVAIIINSCRKDSKVIIGKPTITVSDAKAWYESTYTATVTGGRNFRAFNTGTAGTTDFSQHIKPDWKNAALYTRLGKNVVELPIDPSVTFATELNNATTNKAFSNKKYNRSYFVLLNDGVQYKAYIMMIMADSAYVGNDFTKLNSNSYRHRDPNFSGLVLYFTPKGQYVYGYTYKAGKLVMPSAANTAVSTRNLSIHKVTQPSTKVDYNCIDWYLVTYINNVVVDKQYVGTTCDEVPDGSGGGGTAPAPLCVPPAQTGLALAHASIGHARTAIDEDPGGNACLDCDQGMPPPPDGDTCNNDDVTADNPVKPCALKFQNITSNWMAIAVSGYTIGIQDPVFGTKFITFNVQIGMPNYVSVQQAQNATALAMAIAEATIANTHGVDFFLSAGAQVTYSKEFANLVQDQLIVALGQPAVQVQNSITAGVPIITYATSKNCN